MWRHVVLIIVMVALAGYHLASHLEPDNSERLLREFRVANLVREAIATYQAGEHGKSAPLDFSAVPLLVRQLAAAKVGDTEALNYIQAQPFRFAIRGQTLDARWVFDDTAL
jgi:hypothetical protein